MSYLPLHSLRSPQLDIDNAPIRTFALGQNALFKDFFKAPIMPNVYTTFPRAIPDGQPELHWTPHAEA
jgi:hypothetical protein